MICAAAQVKKKIISGNLFKHSLLSLDFSSCDVMDIYVQIIQKQAFCMVYTNVK